ncbi:MAG: hypothetical protein LBC20_04820 [Planctomycetaceae bacterium]|nr:hypothetical protein [Planctomycetaceae bacterium]
MSEKVFLKQDGMECTVDFEQLKELLREGYVKPQAQMRAEDETTWNLESLRRSKGKFFTMRRITVNGTKLIFLLDNQFRR